ncbi:MULTISPECIES: sensor histidine kinase [unclassified Sphingomonas]|uniref:sensor histidine kinase n=1 Tax=unclassified Sphingomonas TaxID=196159 RepID=UPI0006FBF37A|nr:MULTISPECIES: HAMP domain-containing sensor histidine kinase [unclassified Sphingomonas]KQX25475.1 histidine kinase [Sphingomonas sp. Root1294]KQY66467.1 histidine kinase [Sphingomonas sp. Root50]KRB90215.1 histidine kinase [Sphingomonas sp. Root720]
MTGLRSLRALTAAFLLAFIAATGLTGVAVYRATHSTIATLVDRRIASVSGELAAMGTHSGTPELVRQIRALTGERDTGDLGLLLTSANGRVLAGNIRLRRPLPEGFSTVDRTLGLKGLSVGRALVRPIGDGLILTVVAETEPIDDYDSRRARIYLFGFGSIVLIVVAGVATFGLVIGRRIVAMRHTVEAIVDGDMQRRVPVDGSHSAFDQQAHAFNAMLDRIAALMAEISNVSNDIAHDLRTPLARLRGRLQALAGRAGDGGLADEIEAAIADSDELLAMFAAILRIAEIEGGARRAGFERIDLGTLVHHVATTMQPAAADAGRRLTDGEPAYLPVLGDRQLLAQALINLVENAIRHTPPGSRIGIAATRVGDAAAIVVEDDGPGIAAADRTRALRRFGRLDGSRGSGGHGLGLPLVESIVRLHRGSMRLEDAGPGLRVVIGLPLAP